MAVEVTQRWSSRPLTRTPDGYEADLVWDVTGVSTQQEALGAPGIPTLDTSHPASSSLLCQSVTADTPQGPSVWEVRARYATPPSGTWGGNGTENPLQAPTRVRWRFGNLVERIGRDRNGKPIVNSANTAFANPLTKPFSVLMLTVLRNEPFFDIQKSLTYRNKVNSDQFAIPGAGQVDIGQCMCLDIAPTGEIPITSPAPPYIEIAYEFEFRDGKFPFQPREVDQGQVGYFSDPDNSNAITRGNFTNRYGEVLTSDVFLDGTGKPADSSVRVNGHTPVSVTQLSGRSIDSDQSSTDVKVLRFNVYAEVAMSALFT